ncbi:hypothetical protein PLESTB_000803400 [Pleodorina starrii]|uniref:SLC41A/MgtE integral membrane domain-containing protein n=1 Tax=Pleodorina starrii TaxID=330485 RepID=A0A9W6BKS2_9CHLO|nr:hypothetical protein PLESTM_000637500 [Pleodorina starrii]GLC53914.1 hypothetical protein PLESTB_000803400 [Pleodorina starrii]GLC75399.1 hypothetical protein PLESTF_001632600 [Pleodorina starrii]
MSFNCASPGRITLRRGATSGETALARSCPHRRVPALGAREQPANSRVTMWPLTAMTKKQRHLLGIGALPQPGDRPVSGLTGHTPSRRGTDDSIVLTASAVAPLLPGSTPGSGALPVGTHPHLHHLSHSHGSGGSGLGAGGAGPGPGSVPSGTPASAPVGLPYQRLNAGAGSSLAQGSAGAGSPAPYTSSAASLEEGGVRTGVLSPAARRTQLCDDGLPDPDMCGLGIDSGDEGGPSTTPPANMPVFAEALSRGRWLLGLLIVQSTSSFVLDAYQDLLRDHLVVTLFLTMLVGAGGNAGNQSAIKVIRGLATGAIRPSWPSARATLRDQALVGLLLGTGLSAGGFVRVYATHGDVANAAAISVSLFLIVMTSVVLGAALPFALARAGVDPANAGTSIQVLMDILGVVITCVTCNFVLVQLALGVGAAATAGAALPS